MSAVRELLTRGKYTPLRRKCGASPTARLMKSRERNLRLANSAYRIFDRGIIRLFPDERPVER